MKMARPLVLALIACLTLFGCSKQPGSGEGSSPKSSSKAAPAKPARYGGYSFNTARGIDIGMQPLTLPECSVAELMSRDRVLSKRLSRSGMQLQLLPFYKGKDIGDLMATGELEGGIFADMPALTAAATGDVVLVAVLKQGAASIVARRPMLVKELEGKRVGTAIGSAAHFTLLRALGNEGLTEKDIELVPMEVSEMARALASGRIDAFCAWEPTPSMAFASYPEFHLVHKGLNYGFLCLRRDFVTRHPAEAREIVAAVARACLWMRERGQLEQVARWTIESATKFQGEPFALKPEQMISITRNDLLEVQYSPRIPETLLREQEVLYQKFLFLRKIGKIPENVSWAKVRGSIDIFMLREVMAESDRYDLRWFDFRGNKETGGSR